VENDPNKKALIIKGARQIGKAFTGERFAERNYKRFANVNFGDNRF